MKEIKNLKMLLIVTSLLVVCVPFIVVDIIPGDFSNIIKPLSWIFLAIITYITIPKQTKKYDFKINDIRQFALIGSLIFIILFFSSGMVIGYSNSPFNRTLIGFLKNFWFLGVVLIFQEYVRAKFVGASSKKNLKFVFIYVTLFFALIELNIQADILRINSFDAFLRFLITDFTTIIITSSFISYLAYKDGFVSALLYRLPITIVFLISPVFPANVFIVLFLIETLIPFIIYLKISKLYEGNIAFLQREKASFMQILGKISFLCLLVLMVSFSIGLFPVSPIVIATNSMYPTIERGDIVVKDEVDINDVKIGDIIVYDLNGTSIIHRVIEINRSIDGVFLVAKGDNNRSPDALYIQEEQIRGKIITTIPKAGYPTLMLRQVLNNQNADVNVEMGDN